MSLLDVLCRLCVSYSLLEICSFKFFGNGIVLILFFVPGINLTAFYVVNGFLLGREYFIFAVYFFRPEQEVHAFYTRII